jgi:hypothetical protein
MALADYSPTTLDYTELSTLATQLADIVDAIQLCQNTIELTTNADIVSSPSIGTDAVLAARDSVFAEILAVEISAPLQVAFSALKASLNAIVKDHYGAPPIT